MSVLHACSRCGAEWETGWGDDADDLCRECRRVDERIARGGYGLTSDERGALAEFLGVVVPREGSAFIVDGRLHGMVWGSDERGGFMDFDAVEPVVAADAEIIEGAA